MKRLLAAALFAGAAAALHAAELPVVAGRLVTGPSSHIELTNKSDQPVTAWTLVVTTTEKDGRTHRAVETIDAYLSEVTKEFSGMSDKVDRLLPGQTRDIPLDPVSAGSTAEVTAVILQDGTAVGDADTISSIFQHRAKERDELHEVVSVFDAVFPSSRGRPALEELKRRLVVQSGVAESTAHRSAREAIDAYLLRVTDANADAIDQLVRKYADIFRREYQLAEKHSHPKD